METVCRGPHTDGEKPPSAHPIGPLAVRLSPGQTIYPDGGWLALNYTVPVKDD